MTAEILVLQENNAELDKERKQIIKDMRQNEILHEKETYGLNAKLKEYKYIIHEQKKTILDLDQEMQREKAIRATEQ